MGKKRGATVRSCLAGSFVCIAIAIAAMGGRALADFTDGVVASRISLDTALRIWRKSAWLNDDFLSEVQLGDVYGREEGENKFYDPVESYVWYFLATKSSRIAQFISDDYARRVIAEDYHRALARLSKLMILLTPEQRQDARDRIVYILACRGADGYMQLGRILTTQKDGRGWRSYEVQHPSAYEGLSAVGDAYRNLRLNAEDEIDDGQDARVLQMMGVSSSSVIVPNDGEALLYFHVADLMGQPLAKEYLRRLDRDVRRERPLGDRVADEAAEKAHYWSSPFEFYPGGDSASGVPYTDECYANLDRQKALILAAAKLPAHAAERALAFLGWTPTEIGVRRFQASLVDPPTGRLTAAESVRLIQTAALKGDASSQNALGVMYAHGIGVLRNYVRAEFWFRRAADQRFGAALYHLGVLYKAGPEGIHQDLSKANDYFTASALAGFKPTMNQLGDLLIAAASAPRRPGQH